MIAKSKIWQFKSYDAAQAERLAVELDVSPLVTGILLERGFKSAEAMRDFLYGSSKPFYDPFLLKGMAKAVARIEKALQRGERITVYGDYDVDGITATSLLFTYLRRRGAVVDTYIPRRQSEGYGLNVEALHTLKNNGTGLLITVDCGISGIKEVAAAPAGMDIIITDHHTVPEKLPDALAVIDAKQRDCHYPFKDLSGVGLSFKLCQALEQHRLGDNAYYWEELTELAALGTVADVVPLLGENREIVRRGLRAMAQTPIAGLRELIKVSGCQADKLTSENIGFALAPRLNAVGRLEHAQLAVELLVTQDAVRAEEIAAELNRENVLRQEISRSIMEEAEALLAREKHIDTAIVLAHEGWHQGVIGIVASRLVDKYHLPTILISSDGEVAKGSCRSIPALNMYDAIDLAKELLTQFGGHHQAAGLTLPAGNVEEFRRRFKEYVRAHLREDDYLPRQDVDCVLKPGECLKQEDVEKLELLEPFGCANPAPVFAFQGAQMTSQRAIGRDRTHLQFITSSGELNAYKTLMWNRADLLPFLYDGMLGDLAFIPKINFWHGEVSVQLHALSLKQNLTTGDLREQYLDKISTVTGIARTEPMVTVYVNQPGGFFKDAEHIKVKLYGEAPAGKMAVFFDLPSVPVKNLYNELARQGVRTIILLYNNDDYAAAQADLQRQYPDRQGMALFYKETIARLKDGKTITMDEARRLTDDVSAEAALPVLEELGFISRQGDGFILGNIRKRSLEESHFYRNLYNKRVRLAQYYEQNMRISQADLAREIES